MATDLSDLWPHWRDRWLVYEDDDLLVVDKPAKMAAQPLAECDADDVITRLRAWRGQGDGAAPYLAPMHGLDREASGLLLLSKRKAVNAQLASQLDEGLARRYLVGLRPADATKHRRTARSGRRKKGAGSTRRRRKGGAEAPSGLTREVVEQQGDRCLVALRWAARSQPVRATLSALGTPVAGDDGAGGPPCHRLLLHVAGLELAQPTSGRVLALNAPTPVDFAQWLSDRAAPPWSDTAELARRLHDAIDRRYGLVRGGDTSALRLVNGAGDGFPGVDIDRYGAFLVVALSGAEAVAHREAVLDAVAQLGARGCYLKVRPKHASVVVDTRQDDLAPSHAVRGVDAAEVEVVYENGVPYEVRLGDGLSTGIFLDQRDGRTLVRELSAGKRVLNLFAYHGAFTVAALAGGAAETVTVDSSGVALERAARNLALVGRDPGRHRLRRSAAQPWLERCAAGPKRERFDLIILDPPSFSTAKGAVFRAARDYPALATAALRCLAPGGRLLACTSHRGIVRAKFRRQLADGARAAGREVCEMKTLPDPLDFPPAPGQECHLKSVLLRVAG